jgi:hypothetical protein
MWRDSPRSTHVSTRKGWMEACSCDSFLGLLARSATTDSGRNLQACPNHPLPAYILLLWSQLSPALSRALTGPQDYRIRCQ